MQHQAERQEGWLSPEVLAAPPVADLHEEGFPERPDLGRHANREVPQEQELRLEQVRLLVLGGRVETHHRPREHERRHAAGERNQEQRAAIGVEDAPRDHVEPRP